MKSVRKRKIELSAEAQNATIDRAEFDVVMTKLLQAKRPISKQEISANVKRGRVVSSVGKRSAQR